MNVVGEQKLTIRTSKWIDNLIEYIPNYKKVLSGEITLSNDYGTTAERYRRLEELTRIVNAYETVLGGLGNERRDFLLEYYYSDRGPTINAIAMKFYISEKTGHRWKKDFVEQVAKRLGWL